MSFQCSAKEMSRLLVAALCAYTGAVSLGATASWLGGSGSWNDPTQWSTNPLFPNNGNGGLNFDVAIGAPGTSTITLNSSITVDSLNLNAAATTIEQIGGTFRGGNMQISAGAFVINGGTLADSNVSISGTGTVRFSDGLANSVSNVTFGAPINLSAPGSRVALLSSSTFNGAVTLSGVSSVLGLFGTQTLRAPQVNLEGPFSILSTEVDDGELTIPANTLVRGGNASRISCGEFGDWGKLNPITNNGTIRADIGGTTLSINYEYFRGATTNNGTLAAVAGGRLDVSNLAGNAGTVLLGGASRIRLQGDFTINRPIVVPAGAYLTLEGNWNNTAGISMIDGRINLAGTFNTASATAIARTRGLINIVGRWDNSNSSIAFSTATGTWTLAGGRIRGGTLTIANGALAGSGGLDDVSVRGPLTVNKGLQIYNATTFDNPLTLTGSSPSLELHNVLTLALPQLNINGNDCSVSNHDNFLTIPPTTVIRGGNNSRIYGGYLINRGVIRSDIFGTTLSINNIEFSNLGTLHAANGGQLIVERLHGSCGTILVESRSKLRLSGIDASEYVIDRPLIVPSSGTVSLLGNPQRDSTIDMNGLLLLDYVGASPLHTLRAELAAARNGGGWDGTSPLTSSSAALSENLGRTAVGYAERTDLLPRFPAPIFLEPADDSTMVLRYTLYGDATLDGKTNFLDFSLLAANFSRAGTWTRGDFDYDGLVSIADFALLAMNFNQVLPIDLNVNAAAVPESVGISFAIAIVVAVRRRKRLAHTRTACFDGILRRASKLTATANT